MLNPSYHTAARWACLSTVTKATLHIVKVSQSSSSPVGLPVRSNEAGQVVIQLQQQGIPAGTVATSEAELLLQLHQQPHQ